MYARFVSRRSALAAVAAAGLVASAAGFAAAPAMAQGQPVKIGELNSYSRMAAFAVPYRNGMQLAQDEINAKGGVLGGRKMEIVFRDDGATPGDAVRVAEELLTRENVSFLVGTFLSNVGLAVADFANQKKVLFLATEPLTDAITMAQGNKLHLPRAALDLHADQDAGRGRQGQGRQEVGDRRAQLRVRPVGRRQLQEADQDRDARCRDRRRAVPGARQDRRRRHRRRARAGQARRHLQRAVRRRPHACSCARATRAACSRSAPWRAC